tara:strand:+ start:903 stop:1553 length:651 start_codon:yes stop_codon:yes gene_type:complete
MDSAQVTAGIETAKAATQEKSAALESSDLITFVTDCEQIATNYTEMVDKVESEFGAWASLVEELLNCIEGMIPKDEPQFGELLAAIEGIKTEFITEDQANKLQTATNESMPKLEAAMAKYNELRTSQTAQKDEKCKDRTPSEDSEDLVVEMPEAPDVTPESPEEPIQEPNVTPEDSPNGPTDPTYGGAKKIGGGKKRGYKVKSKKAKKKGSKKGKN